MDDSSPYEDWGPDDEDVLIGNCDRCDRKGVPVRYTTDPFMDEVYGEQTDPENWCGRCWHERKDDV